VQPEREVFASNDRDRRSPQIGGVGKDQGEIQPCRADPLGATADLLNVASHSNGVQAIEKLTQQTHSSDSIIRSAHFCQAACETLWRVAD
jgi:hypothetical protein